MALSDIPRVRNERPTLSMILPFSLEDPHTGAREYILLGREMPRTGGLSRRAADRLMESTATGVDPLYSLMDETFEFFFFFLP